jgi:hypothetical protein
MRRQTISWSPTLAALCVALLGSGAAPAAGLPSASPERMTKDTYLRLFSMTKPVTSVAPRASSTARAS